MTIPGLPYRELDDASRKAAMELFEMVLADALADLSDKLTADLKATGIPFQLTITAAFEPLDRPVKTQAIFDERGRHVGNRLLED